MPVEASSRAGLTMHGSGGSDVSGSVPSTLTAAAGVGTPCGAQERLGAILAQRGGERQRARAGVAHAGELEQRRQHRLVARVAGERLAEVEDQVGRRARRCRRRAPTAASGVGRDGKRLDGVAARGERAGHVARRVLHVGARGELRIVGGGRSRGCARRGCTAVANDPSDGVPASTAPFRTHLAAILRTKCAIATADSASTAQAVRPCSRAKASAKRPRRRAARAIGPTARRSTSPRCRAGRRAR